ncbi:putative Upstream stimulatory factor 1 [Hypsibius exemplaris]|uniref:Upstream stimulatory factor 1 n=1 Tax=Hypsibius exemplaris TaxID=2072580 RepID=A0A1W0WDI2_HYPEX|nr:putative Upstream stimulatory factor 1 [Hypsibius exemplaris]
MTFFFLALLDSGFHILSFRSQPKASSAIPRPCLFGQDAIWSFDQPFCGTERITLVNLHTTIWPIDRQRLICGSIDWLVDLGFDILLEEIVEGISETGSMSEHSATEEYAQPEPGPSLKRQKKDNSRSNITTLEPAITIVRGEADGTTTYYKIISTSTPGASSLSSTEGGTGMESVGKVQLINGSLHFPNGTIVVPSTSPGEILNNSDMVSLASTNLLSQPTMVSVSIPGSSGGRFQSSSLDGSDSKRRGAPPGGVRDERRRQTHNEVERRRRDKINSWITKLQAIMPGGPLDNSKHSQSKGVVLSKAVDYITLLQQQLEQARTVKDTSQKMHLLAIENEVYKKQAEVLKTYLREQGMELPANMPHAALNALQELQQGTAILIAQQTTRQNKQ